MTHKPLIIGHRGLTGTDIADNSEQAIRGAYIAGFDGVEIDVQLTKDLVPILWHDEFLGDTTVHQQTFQMCQDNLDYPLMTLGKAIDLVKTLKLYLMCELKVYSDCAKQLLADITFKLIMTSDLHRERFLIASFDTEILEYASHCYQQIDYAFCFDRYDVKLPKIQLKAQVFPCDMEQNSATQCATITYKHPTIPEVLDEQQFAYVVDRARS